MMAIIMSTNTPVPTPIPASAPVERRALSLLSLEFAVDILDGLGELGVEASVPPVPLQERFCMRPSFH